MPTKKLMGVSSSTTKKKIGKVIDPKDLNVSFAEISEPEKELSAYDLFIYGLSEIGKTTFCSQFPDTYFLMMERGGKALRLRQAFCPTWEHALAHQAIILKNLESGKVKLQTIIIDTGQEAYEKCKDHYCREHNIDQPGYDPSNPDDKSRGKDWNLIEKRFKTFYETFKNHGLTTVSTAHSEVKKMTLAGRKNVDYTYINLSTQAARYFKRVTDMRGFYNYDGITGRRILTIAGSQFLDAGHRIEEHFLYSDGTPMTDIPMGTSKEEAYKNFNLAFNNRFKRPKGQQLT